MPCVLAPFFVLVGGLAGFVLTAEFVVIGERPQRHAPRMRTARDIGRRKLAVGNGGVTVEVGVHHRLWRGLQPFYCNAVSGRRANLAVRRAPWPPPSPRYAQNPSINAATCSGWASPRCAECVGAR